MLRFLVGLLVRTQSQMVELCFRAAGSTIGRLVRAVGILRRNFKKSVANYRFIPWFNLRLQGQIRCNGSNRLNQVCKVLGLNRYSAVRSLETKTLHLTFNFRTTEPPVTSETQTFDGNLSTRIPLD